MTNQSNGLRALSDALAAAAERGGAATVRVNARRRLPASGIAWAEGIVVTADHVIERDDNLSITLPDGKDVSATIAGRDPASDIAVLRAAHGLAPAARATETRVGHLALALGRGTGTLTASMGVVSAISAAGRPGRSGGIEQYIRADVTMYPGFSGGPLVDVDGAVIGLNSSALGGGATIPMAEAQKIVDALQQHGRLKRGFLGVTSQPVRLPQAVAATAGQETGLLIARVEPGTPADQGGLMIGDIIVGMGGAPVRDTDELQVQLGPDRVGQPTVVRIVRGGELREVSVTVGERN